jgi:hypothetical protein
MVFLASGVIVFVYSVTSLSVEITEPRSGLTTFDGGSTGEGETMKSQNDLEAEILTALSITRLEGSRWRLRRTR